jgi:hypothetical protein
MTLLTWAPLMISFKGNGQRWFASAPALRETLPNLRYTLRV